MRRFFYLLVLVPAMSYAAWFGSGGPVDYAQDAGNMFYCANPSGSPITSQAGVSVSSPTLALYNPIGSGKNLTLLNVNVEPTVAPTTAADVFLAFNLTPSSGVFLSSGGVAGNMVSANLVAKSTGTLTTAIAKCTIQGTLPALPVAFRYEGVISTTTVSGILDPVQGQVVVPPGGLISIQATAAASLLADFLWREDPL